MTSVGRASAGAGQACPRGHCVRLALASAGRVAERARSGSGRSRRRAAGCERLRWRARAAWFTDHPGARRDDGDQPGCRDQRHHAAEPRTCGYALSAWCLPGGAHGRLRGPRLGPRCGRQEPDDRCVVAPRLPRPAGQPAAAELELLGLRRPGPPGRAHCQHGCHRGHAHRVPAAVRRSVPDPPDAAGGSIRAATSGPCWPTTPPRSTAAGCPAAPRGPSMPTAGRWTSTRSRTPKYAAARSTRQPPPLGPAGPGPGPR